MVKKPEASPCCALLKAARAVFDADLPRLAQVFVLPFDDCLRPKPRRVLVGDAGAIPYAADLPALDTTALHVAAIVARLHEEGWALHNLASLPHISIAGAVATATFKLSAFPSIGIFTSRSHAAS